MAIAWFFGDFEGVNGGLLVAKAKPSVAFIAFFARYQFGGGAVDIKAHTVTHHFIIKMARILAADGDLARVIVIAIVIAAFELQAFRTRQHG